MQGPNVPDNIPIIGQAKKNPPKVMVGIPYYRDISPKTMGALMQLMGSFPADWSNMWHGTANVVQGRNVISEAFMESDAEYLFFVDSDMVFHPQHFMELFAKLQEHPDAGLIGGMYTKRDGSLTPLVGCLNEEGFPQGVDEHIAWLLENRGKVVDADLIPTGFMLIRRKAFEALEKPYFYRDWPWKDQEVDEEWRAKMWSSDNVFVREVKKAGLRVLAHLGVELGHIGEMIYVPEHFYQQAQQFTVSGQIQRLKAQFGAEYGYDTKEYWDKLYATELQAGRTRDYPELHEAVRAAIIGKQKVLDMGSGPGILAKKLQTDGHEVTCADFSEVAVGVCESQGFEAFQFDLQKDSPGPDQHGRYDVVLATEVLEHLEDPEKAIKRLYSFLKPGGLMIVSTPDQCLPPEEEPEHKQLVTEAGMRIWLKPLEQVEVLHINTQPFPKLLGMGVKPEKK